MSRVRSNGRSRPIGQQTTPADTSTSVRSSRPMNNLIKVEACCLIDGPALRSLAEATLPLETDELSRRSQFGLDSFVVRAHEYGSAPHGSERRRSQLGRDGSPPRSDLRPGHVCQRTRQRVEEREAVSTSPVESKLCRHVEASRSWLLDGLNCEAEPLRRSDGPVPLGPTRGSSEWCSGPSRIAASRPSTYNTPSRVTPSSYPVGLPVELASCALLVGASIEQTVREPIGSSPVAVANGIDATPVPGFCTWWLLERPPSIACSAFTVHRPWRRGASPAVSAASAAARPCGVNPLRGFPSLRSVTPQRRRQRRDYDGRRRSSGRLVGRLRPAHRASPARTRKVERLSPQHPRPGLTQRRTRRVVMDDTRPAIDPDDVTDHAASHSSSSAAATSRITSAATVNAVAAARCSPPPTSASRSEWDAASTSSRAPSDQPVCGIHRRTSLRESATTLDSTFPVRRATSRSVGSSRSR